MTDHHIKALESRIERLEQENRQLIEAWKAFHRHMEAREIEKEELMPVVTALESVLERVLGVED